MSQLCVPSACSPSRKAGHHTKVRASLWSVSAEHGDPSFSVNLFDVSTDISEVTEGGTNVSTPAQTADIANLL